MKLAFPSSDHHDWTSAKGAITEVDLPSEVVPSPNCRMPTTVTSLAPACVASWAACPTSSLPCSAISLATATSPLASGRRPAIGVYGFIAWGRLENTKFGAPPWLTSCSPFATR